MQCLSRNHQKHYSSAIEFLQFLERNDVTLLARQPFFLKKKISLITTLSNSEEQELGLGDPLPPGARHP